MDANRYKALCNRPNTFSEDDLNKSILGLKRAGFPEEAEIVGGILYSPPIPRPRLHTGGSYTDHFEVDLDYDQVEKVVQALAEAEAANVGQDGDTTPQASHFATLVDLWDEYQKYLSPDQENE